MPNTAKSEVARHAWREVVAKYEIPSLYRSLRQVANTIVPYCALVYLMYRSLDVSYWITLALAIPAAGFLVRSFIIGHDCGHGSFFKSKKANRFVGFFTTLLPFLPSYHWSHEHARHHAAAGDLDRRGHGDIWTVTVEEYVAMPRWKQIWYRLYRHPVFLLGVGPLYVFLLNYRFWRPGANSRVRMNTLQTNLAIAIIITVASLTIGFKAYVMIQLPILVISGAAGIWLFYVQHQFENTYWSRHEDWDYVQSALDGASFYKLPRVLQWFTGNIGFHHVHHLSPRIPNYYLQSCHESHPMFETVKHITLGSSLKCLSFRLWDEDHKKLVGFSYVPVYRAEQALLTGR